MVQPDEGKILLNSRPFFSGRRKAAENPKPQSGLLVSGLCPVPAFDGRKKHPVQLAEKIRAAAYR
nr:hypothetical protein [Planococcus glaciei]